MPPDLPDGSQRSTYASSQPSPTTCVGPLVLAIRSAPNDLRSTRPTVAGASDNFTYSTSGVDHEVRLSPGSGSSLPHSLHRALTLPADRLGL